MSEALCSDGVQLNVPQKITKSYYDAATGPAKVEPESEAEPKEESAPAPSAEPESPARSARGDTSMEVDDVEAPPMEVGPSNSADGDSYAGGGRSGRKRGTYMKDGPTVYKLVKPVLKAIKEAQAQE